MLSRLILLRLVSLGSQMNRCLILPESIEMG